MAVGREPRPASTARSHGRSEQLTGRFLESTDSDEPFGQRGVAYGNAQHPVEIGVSDTEQRRTSSLHLGVEPGRSLRSAAMRC
jgi:hypothetical protein